MPKDSRILTYRNDELQRKFTELSSQGYSTTKILQELSQRFFLAERTIYGIVSGEYERRKSNCETDDNQV